MRSMNVKPAELRHIVDVDGQLFGIEPATVNATVLKALAGVTGDLMQVRGEFEVPLGALQSISLREDEVMFFRSRPSASEQGWRYLKAA
jgi:hypothetical protein